MANSNLLSGRVRVTSPKEVSADRYEFLDLSQAETNFDTIIGGDLTVSGSIFAEEIIVNLVSSSVIYSSGSNKFGDELTDKQEFTGSVEISGSLTNEGII